MHAEPPVLPETIKALLRSCLTAATRGRPLLDLSGPVTKVSLWHDEAGSALAVEAARNEIGLRYLIVRLLPTVLTEDALESLTEPTTGRDDAAVVVVAADLTSAMPADLRGLRDLVYLARTTGTPDEFDAAVRRSSAGPDSSAAGTVDSAARVLLVRLYAGEATDARRRRLHALLRRLVVPRTAEVSRSRQIKAKGPREQLRVDELHERAVVGWPEPFEHCVLEPESAPVGGTVAVPELGGPAEAVTRHVELAALAGHFADTTRTAKVALVAESGMGKSSLAARTGRELASHYNAVGWLSASDALSWKTSCAALADRFGTVPETLWEELAGRGPALLIVDDAPGPEQFAELPDLPGLHVLVTSQSLGWRAAAEVIELPPLPLAEAVEYLLARTGARDEQLVEKVAGQLGGFPLALEQAAVAIIGGVSMSGWLDRHQADPSYGAAALRDIWELRLVQLRDGNPEASLLLRTLACAGSTPIPAALLEKLGDDFPNDITLPFAADRVRRDAAVAELRRQGLIRTGVDTETFQLHPLLAQVVLDVHREDFDVADTVVRVGAAASWLMNRYDPVEVSTWPVAASLATVALTSCMLVFEAMQKGYRGLPPEVPRTLADRALWPVATYLSDMGASHAAYRTRLLALAFYGDTRAAQALRDQPGELSAQFRDLTPADIVPAIELGAVHGAQDRLLAARWINENAPMLCDLDLDIALSYARRALEIVPRRVPSAGTTESLPWSTRIRVEILNNLGGVECLRQEYEKADRTLLAAQRLLRSHPGAEDDEKYGELINDRALIHLDRGSPDRARKEFERSASFIRKVLGPQVSMLDNIENNLARAEHHLWWLRSAGKRLQTSMDRMWDRLDPRDSAVIVHQCNTGLIRYDLGETETGLRLVEGAWRTLADRLGPDDRETVNRLTMLGDLRRYRGDLEAALSALKHDMAVSEKGEHSPWGAIRLVQAAWLSGIAALTPESARRLAEPVLEEHRDGGTHAALALDMLTAHALAGGRDAAPDADGIARRAIAVHRRAVGPDHPGTFLAQARLALLRQDRSGKGKHGGRPLVSTGARRLLLGLDSLTRPGPEGFASDLSRAGQVPVDLDRPGWEADRLVHLLEDGIVELSNGERILWTANAGRLGALAGRGDLGLLGSAAEASAALFGIQHPWALLHSACDAVVRNDPEALRLVLCIPFWT